MQRYGAGMSSEAAVESSMIARSRYNNKTAQHCFVARWKARSKARSKAMGSIADDHKMQT